MLDPDTPQNVTATLASGVLRIDVDRKGHGVSHPIPRRPGSGATRGYFVPDDNPFVGRADTLEEYWAVGLRNPFRISFDPETGALWAGDVGSAEWEEVNLLLAGRNYQYPFIEGREETGRPRSGASIGTEAGPIFTYRHTAYDRAVVGGIVYRGTRHPGLRGQYLFADNYSGKVFSIPATGEPVDAVELLAQADQVAQRGITRSPRRRKGRSSSRHVARLRRRPGDC
jgi:glucose/arabinose dehydrogenase